MATDRDAASAGAGRGTLAAEVGPHSRDEDGTYANAPAADLFPHRAKPSYVGGILEMANTRLFGFWNNLTGALKTERGTRHLAVLLGMPSGSARPAGMSLRHAAGDSGGSWVAAADRLALQGRGVTRSGTSTAASASSSAAARSPPPALHIHDRDTGRHPQGRAEHHHERVPAGLDWRVGDQRGRHGAEEGAQHVETMR
ncbi:hypothetical protein [Streptomyces sp. MK5]|uniref:hypothetical protein n=1 Tax=Streptomyces sp. MK5 TaxID=3064253 RepID=UPI002741437B|nr:hypothetical protein [Streptomyces sp. MK5]